MACASGALYWADADALIVADLHLEKASSFARWGQYLPPYDTRETLSRLAGVLRRYPASTVIALGDSFHDEGASGRLSAADFATLRGLQKGRTWIWITGNHDNNISSQFGGRVYAEFEIGIFTFRHVPSPIGLKPEIAGHMHPAARISLSGQSIRRPCFVNGANRVILPAFGAFTGGLNVVDEAFGPLIGNVERQVWMLGRERVYPVALKRLRPD